MKKPRKYEQMKNFQEIYDDLSDGAFFAVGEEQNIYTGDWVQLAEYEDWLAKQTKGKKHEAKN